MNPTITVSKVKDEYDLLAAQLRAGLIAEDESYIRRRRELLRMAHDSVRQARAGEKYVPDTSWYPVEVTI